MSGRHQLTRRQAQLPHYEYPRPGESAITQCSSLCWISSTLNVVSSARRRPQPRRMASVAQSRFPRRLPMSTVRRRRLPCSAESQLTNRAFSRRMEFWRGIGPEEAGNLLLARIQRADHGARACSAENRSRPAPLRSVRCWEHVAHHRQLRRVSAKHICAQPDQSPAVVRNG